MEATLQKIFATLLITAAPVCKYCDILGKFGQEMIFFISSVFILWENNNKPSEIQPNKDPDFFTKEDPFFTKQTVKNVANCFPDVDVFFSVVCGQKKKNFKAVFT